MSSSSPPNPQVRALIARLQTRMNRALEVFTTATGEERSDHPCAMSGHLADLIAHNAEHERMHYGQISDRRYSLGALQRTPRERYLAEWYRERATLIALLLDLPDELLDREPEPGVTTIRQIVEHVLFWDEDSTENTAARLTADSNRNE
ncbi:MAG: DinB family protein [Capsulimonadales bacterium]|nr:DinB family protein [Capsulimonadales bacterium]